VVGQASDEDRTWAVASFSVFFDIGFGAGGPIVGAIVALTSVRAGFVGGALITLASLLFLRTVAASLAPTGPAAAPAGATAETVDGSPARAVRADRPAALPAPGTGADRGQRSGPRSSPPPPPSPSTSAARSPTW
jgi:hypothetical protein